MSYLSLTDADREEMLEAIGVSSVAELFEQVPPGVRLGRALDLPPALGEAELVRHVEALAARNVHTGSELSFLGAGMTVWMLYRGMPSRAIWEMTATMPLLALVLLVLGWLGVVPIRDLALLEHGLMMPVMLAPMLIHVGLYTGHMGRSTAWPPIERPGSLS